jgi:hypothetical protein
MQRPFTPQQPNPENRNQKLIGGLTYKGLPLMHEKAPFIEEYLEALHNVLQMSLEDYSRVFAMRFDLRFPAHIAEHEGNEVMSRFIESLKAKIRHDRARARAHNANAHDTAVRYVWAREVGQERRVHYHAVILLNRDAYFRPGRYDSNKENMAGRIVEAWASALRLPVDETIGCAEFPKNPTYLFGRGDESEMLAFFRRASYLCKAKTKQFGNGQHGFGASKH